MTKRQYKLIKQMTSEQFTKWQAQNSQSNRTFNDI